MLFGHALYSLGNSPGSTGAVYFDDEQYYYPRTIQHTRCAQCVIVNESGSPFRVG